ncbi:ribulose bisphosphate carboxylase/oxygenase activase, chloroplastic [Cinnamomum micranthum f. kanehirae]|uniref:Ribulose bisphosphate carboxylase/oxygenase activase, chloroplastic n=1 Tax=Cinnamomum micranthum f. kanehirae TaxID=337451 RepID=A0A443N9V8_9MAGN|nr:ribulose bisphosphate carboxylase/oxygenase activase, chloroplastic [Cinnamomum micranthum f. kanehirae]
MSLLCNNRSFPNPIQSSFDRPQKRIPPSISLRIRNQRLDADDEKWKKKLSDQSSWETKDSEGKDYLYRLGKEADNMNIAVGARKGMIDDLFVGNFLGKDSDIVFDYRQKVTRSFEYLQGDYYIAPVFMDKIVCHIVKNYIAHLLNTKVPLILGIWGGKGQGKSFQTELIFQAMGIEPVIMSAGELESEKAGEPGRLIRERYRTASQVVQNQGKMSCLMVNDIDAGLGRFGNTQMTVNNQIVVGTLMNLCDNPTRVSIGQDWRESDITQRVPVIVTGNDFSTLYAPLIRDGRMEKQPDREDIINIVHRMYEKDGITRSEVVSIVDTFPNQALDFYGALRSRTYDRSISKWINDIGGYENLGEKLLKARKDDKIPTFVPPKQTVEALLESGYTLIKEQELIMNTRLSKENDLAMINAECNLVFTNSITSVISNPMTIFIACSRNKDGLHCEETSLLFPSFQRFVLSI